VRVNAHAQNCARACASTVARLPFNAFFFILFIFLKQLFSREMMRKKKRLCNIKRLLENTKIPQISLLLLLFFSLT